MAGPVPVKGTEISSAPCSVRRAARLLRRFLASEAGGEVGIAKGYIEAVAVSLEEMLARRRENSGNVTEGLRLEPAGRSSKFFNVQQVQEVLEAETKKKSRKEKEEKVLEESEEKVLEESEEKVLEESEEKVLEESEEKVLEESEEKVLEESEEKVLKELKQKKKDQAMVDFEALLGHELDGAEAGEQADGELGFEEKSAVTEMLPSTARQADSVDDGRESQKSEKRKKRKSLVGGAMDVDMDGMQSTSKAEGVVMDSHPDTTKSEKKKKKRKSVDGVVSNGLLSSVDTPAKASKVEAGVARAEDEDMKPADDGRKKKKKHGSTPMKEESKEVLTEHMNSNVGDRGSNGNDSEVQQGSAKKKSKKRASEESPVVKAFNF